MRAAFAWLVVVVALAGCGGGDDDDDADGRDAAAAPRELLAQAERRLREQASFSFAAETVRTRADRPDDPERYATAEGEVDLASGTGELTFELDLELDDDAGALDETYEVAWTRDTVTVRAGENRRELPRAQARESGGLVGRLPDEPEALIGLLGEAREARVVGEEELDGEDVTRVAFLVDMRMAGREGVPAEVADGAAAGSFGDDLPMEAWIDGDGVPRRIAYELRQDEQRAADGTLILPKRTVRVTYDLSGF